MTKALEDMNPKELGMLFPIHGVPYDERWPDLYYAEEERLREAVGDEIVRISHIGSTAVPGLWAKPTIDILLEVRPSCDTGALTERLCGAGWRKSPQPDNPPPHLLFLRGYTEEGFQGQAMHLHVRYPDVWEELCFRDYLRRYPEEAAGYAALKQKLAKDFENDREAYTNAKSAYILSRNPGAMAEFGDRHAVRRSLRPQVDAFLRKVPGWALSDPRIDAVILCGSTARGTDAIDSDVDLCILSEKKADLIEESALFDRFGTAQANAVELHGACTSVRVWYEDGVEAEFGFVLPKWIGSPLDPGTKGVLSGGFCVLADKRNLFYPHRKYRY